MTDTNAIINPQTSDPLRDAINFCIKYLARREYSKKELRDKLSQYHYDDETITECLHELAANNYQSDVRFAEMFTRTRVNQRYGPKKILFELAQKGIDNSLATTAIHDYHDEFLSNAEQLILRKLSPQQLAAIDSDWQQKQKIMRFLVGRGYDYDTINLAFETLQSQN